MSAKKILVVEDHRDTRELLKYNLAAAGFDVAAADDGQSGLKLANGFRPDIILLDLMMPGMDGLEVCRQLKGDGELARIPVIMLTAKGEEIDKIVGLELGADDYVVKPFSPRELVLRIKAVLRRSGAPEPDAPKAWERLGLKIDFEAHQISIDGEEVPLTATEFKAPDRAHFRHRESPDPGQPPRYGLGHPFRRVLTHGRYTRPPSAPEARPLCGLDRNRPGCRIPIQSPKFLNIIKRPVSALTDTGRSSYSSPIAVIPASVCDDDSV